jgi:hypothetical protein
VDIFRGKFFYKGKIVGNLGKKNGYKLAFTFDGERGG